MFTCENHIVLYLFKVKNTLMITILILTNILLTVAFIHYVHYCPISLIPFFLSVLSPFSMWIRKMESWKWKERQKRNCLKLLWFHPDPQKRYSTPKYYNNIVYIRIYITILLCSQNSGQLPHRKCFSCFSATFGV